VSDFQQYARDRLARQAQPEMPTRDTIAEKLWHIDAPPGELNWPDDCRDEERYYCMADVVLALFGKSESKP